MVVGVPNFRFPISLNACPSILRNFVHRTTSHGILGVSLGVRSLISATWLEMEDIRERMDDGVIDPGGSEEYEDRRWCRRISNLREGEYALAGERYPYPFDLLGVAGEDEVASEPSCQQTLRSVGVKGILE
jgi:hypothetical protein